MYIGNIYYYYYTTLRAQPAQRVTLLRKHRVALAAAAGTLPAASCCSRTDARWRGGDKRRGVRATVAATGAAVSGAADDAGLGVCHRLGP